MANISYVAQLLRENAIHQDQLMAQEEQRQKMRSQLQEMKLKQNAGIEADTQTDVDDFGVFDRREGWVLPISGTVAVRNRWKRGMRFAGCPHCKGIGTEIRYCSKMISISPFLYREVRSASGCAYEKATAWRVGL